MTAPVLRPDPAAIRQAAAILKEGGLVADIKGVWRKRSIPNGLPYWTL